MVWRARRLLEAVNPTAEDAYWRENYRNRPYFQPGADYDQYEPAYRYGYTAYTRIPAVTSTSRAGPAS